MPCQVAADLGLGEPGASLVQAPSLGTRDQGRHRNHDLAENTGERLVQPLTRFIDDGQRGIGVRGGGDERPVDPLQEMARQRRPARERKRTPQQPLGRRAVAGGQLDLGQPLQRMRRAGIGSHLHVQGKRLREIGAGRVEVSGEQSRLTGHRHGERHAASCTGPLGLLARLARQGHHLVVWRRPVQQVLGHAQVRVEDRRGKLRVLGRGAELATEPVEPLAAVVGDHALEGDDVEQAVRCSGRQGHGASRFYCRVSGVDITGEVGEHAPHQQDCAVV